MRTRQEREKNVQFGNVSSIGLELNTNWGTSGHLWHLWPVHAETGVYPPSFATRTIETVNLVASSSSYANYTSTSSLFGVSNAARPPPLTIPTFPIFVESISPNDGGNSPFSRISQSANPPPPLTTFLTATGRTEELPCYFGKISEDVHSWTSLVRHYLAFMSGNNTQQVAYTVTLICEAAQEW